MTTQFQDDLFGIKTTPLLKLSPSVLNIFCDCPRCFWLYINKSLKRPSIPVATITTGLDKVIKANFDTYRSKNTLPDILKDKVPGKLISQLPKKGWLDYIEKKDNARLGGFLDECLDLGNNYYAALDHKTRGSAPTQVHSAYHLQMDAYTFLLERNNLPTKRMAYLVYYIPNKINQDNTFSFEVLIKEVKTNPDRAYKIFLEATKVARGPVPKLSTSCMFCNWIKTKEIK